MYCLSGFNIDPHQLQSQMPHTAVRFVIKVFPNGIMNGCDDNLRVYIYLVFSIFKVIIFNLFLFSQGGWKIFL